MGRVMPGGLLNNGTSNAGRAVDQRDWECTRSCTLPTPSMATCQFEGWCATVFASTRSAMFAAARRSSFQSRLYWALRPSFLSRL